jgi:hypothetical protein
MTSVLSAEGPAWPLISTIAAESPDVAARRGRHAMVACVGDSPELTAVPGVALRRRPVVVERANEAEHAYGLKSDTMPRPDSAAAGRTRSCRSASSVRAPPASFRARVRARHSVRRGPGPASRSGSAGNGGTARGARLCRRVRRSGRRQRECGERQFGTATHRAVRLEPADAMPRYEGAAPGGAAWATPIIESRVTSAASCFSFIVSLPSGRRGITR